MKLTFLTIFGLALVVSSHSICAQELAVSAADHGRCRTTGYYSSFFQKPEGFLKGSSWGMILVRENSDHQWVGETGGFGTGAVVVEPSMPGPGWKWTFTPHHDCQNVLAADGTKYILAPIGNAVLEQGGSFQMEIKKDKAQIKGLFAYANQTRGDLTIEVHPASEKGVHTMMLMKGPKSIFYRIAAVCKVGDVCRSLEEQEVTVSIN